jgi:hypothetical protein
MVSPTAAGLFDLAALVVVLGFATDGIDFLQRYLNLLPRQESDQCAVSRVRGIAQSPHPARMLWRDILGRSAVGIFLGNARKKRSTLDFVPMGLQDSAWGFNPRCTY